MRGIFFRFKKSLFVPHIVTIIDTKTGQCFSRILVIHAHESCLKQKKLQLGFRRTSSDLNLKI